MSKTWLVKEGDTGGSLTSSDVSPPSGYVLYTAADGEADPSSETHVWSDALNNIRVKNAAELADGDTRETRQASGTQYTSRRVAGLTNDQWVTYQRTGVFP